MNNKINKKTFIICGILLLLTFILYFYINNKDKIFSESNEYEEYIITRYEANSYIPVYVTEADMANKYLNDFKYLLLNDLKEAYNVLNDTYRTVKYENYEDFENTIKEKYSLTFYSMSVDKYKVMYKNGLRIFYISDKSGNIYIFKENSIMNYEVYLDDVSVSIE